ncbi:beta strand repeat-containing protein, partial [Candidatus Omnitrophota bacterium]
GEIRQVITGLKPSTVYSVGVQMRVDASSEAQVQIDDEDTLTSTTLSADIGTTGPIARIEVVEVSNVVDGPVFPPFGTIIIDTERIRYDALDLENNYFLKLTRGVDDTDPLDTHVSTDSVTIAPFDPLIETSAGNFASYEGQFATDRDGSDVTIRLSATSGSAYFDSVQVVAGGTVPEFMPNTIVDTGDQTVYGSLRLGRTSDDKGGILSVDKYVRTRGIELFTDDPGLSGSLGGGGATLADSGIYPPGEGYNDTSYLPATVDLFVSGDYVDTAPQHRSYKVKITTNATPDQFTWWKSDETNQWVETQGGANIGIGNTNPISLGDGISISFSSTTAGSENDTWYFSASNEENYGGYDSYAETATYVSGKTRIYKEDDPSSPYYNNLIFENGSIKRSLAELAGEEEGSQATISQPQDYGVSGDLHLETGGAYTDTSNATYYVKISDVGDGTSDSDKFKWSTDNSTWFPVNPSDGTPITGYMQPLGSFGILVRFGGGTYSGGSGYDYYTGGVADDLWTFAVTAGSSTAAYVTSLEGVSGAVTLSGSSFDFDPSGQIININLSSTVGIGTTDPSTALHVTSTGVTIGEDTASGANTAGVLDIISAGSVDNYASTFTAGTQTADVNYTLPTAGPGGENYALTSSVAGQMSWTDLSSTDSGWTDGDPNVYVTDITDNVGIGTTNPDNALDVVGAVSIGSLGIGNTAPANGLIVEGSVGIGTTNPGSTLEILSTGSLAIPQGTAPTVDAAGELAIDIDADDTGTSGYIDQGWLTYHDGTQQMYVPAFDAIGTPSDNDVIAYNAGTDKWIIEAQVGAGGSNAWSDAVDSDILPTGNDDTFDLGSAAASFADIHWDGTAYGNVTGALNGNASTATNIADNTGTTTTVLHGNAAGSPSFAAVTLGTDTSGNYVLDVADGTGIDGTASGVGTTYTPTFDATELDDLTWDAGSLAAITWTWSTDTTDPTMTFENTGHIGIGTTNPTSALDVDGTVTATGFTGIVETDLPTAIDATKIADGTVTSAEFQYLGDVTSLIQAQIDAKGTGTMSDLVDDLTPELGGDLDALEKIIDNVGDITHDDGTASDWTFKNVDLDKDIIFNINDGSVDTEVLRIDGDVARVGIGTTAPDSALDVDGTVTATGFTGIV